MSMNAAFHKAQAEGLIKMVNEGQWHRLGIGNTIALAQVHATLATIPDKDTD